MITGWQLEGLLFTAVVHQSLGACLRISFQRRIALCSNLIVV